MLDVKSVLLTEAVGLGFIFEESQPKRHMGEFPDAEGGEMDRPDGNGL